MKLGYDLLRHTRGLVLGCVARQVGPEAVLLGCAGHGVDQAERRGRANGLRQTKIGQNWVEGREKKGKGFSDFEKQQTNDEMKD
jgi:hypothetical protein